MKVGFVGLGKLGLPVAAAMALRGADVVGFDVDANRMSYKPQPYREAGPDGTGDFNRTLHGLDIAEHVTATDRMVGLERLDTMLNIGTRVPGTLRFVSLAEVVASAVLLFVAVQAPTDP